MSVSVVGRDSELASILDFVARISDGAAALVLEGEAGMGKTTLWRAAVEHAADRGVLVLQSEPVESETTLSFAGLGDLLDPVLDRALAVLPPVQVRALTRALALGDDDQPDLDARALRVAIMGCIRALAEERPVLVAIDDSQWLDYASSAALAYGVRRFRAEPIGLLLSRRSGMESVLLSELLRSPAGERFTNVQVGLLDHVELGRVIHEHLGASLARPLLAEVHQASGGNPFYALEIVRMLQRTGFSIEAGQPVPVPESLHELVHRRVLALPGESREFLLAAAAHAHPTVALTEAASGVSRTEGLEPALEARVVELDGERIRFTHPLLAAGVYEAASPLRRLEVHRRLAELLDDPEARAWQLAASVEEPDESVAAVLEDAARHAGARGAPRPAALLLDRASELTPPTAEGEATRRAVDASYLHFEAGDAARAERVLREIVAGLPVGKQRSRALWVLAKVRSYEAADEAAELFLEVIEQCDGDEETLARAHEGVAASLWIDTRRLEEALEHARTAVEMALARDDEALCADALISQLGTELWLGRNSAVDTAERALALQASTEDRRINDQPLVGVVEYWLLSGRHDDARDAIEEMLHRADETGDESSRPYLLFLLGWAEGRAGEVRRAVEHARQGREAAEQSGQPVFAAYNVALGAMHAAQLGESQAVIDARREARALAPTNGHVELLTTAAVGHLALAREERRAAVESLGHVRAAAERAGIGEPEVMRFVVDEIEALVELGEDVEARGLLETYDVIARRLERTASLANCARCRGLLAAQAGDLDAAMDAFQEALELHAEVLIPLDRGRTLLALGATQRRAKRRREARTTLEEALGVFERIGAALWAERARGELKRISGRAATPGALTPAEERVAALVLQGKTNKEVAAALFLSDRTVEGHLARIFGKLGIRHRTELAGALQTRGIALPNTGDTPVSAEPLAP